MEVNINKEIKEYNETMFFGLSVRQFIFALLACGAAVGKYFMLTKSAALAGGVVITFAKEILTLITGG